MAVHMLLICSIRWSFKFLALEQKNKDLPASLHSPPMKGCFMVHSSDGKKLPDLVEMCSSKRGVKLEDIQHWKTSIFNLVNFIPVCLFPLQFLPVQVVSFLLVCWLQAMIFQRSLCIPITVVRSLPAQRAHAFCVLQYAMHSLFEALKICLNASATH